MRFPIITIIYTLAVGLLASEAQLNAREIEKMVAHTIDPKTMDPTRFSVLSVLKTAIPTGAFPKPTGDFEPEWFSNLPADVKSLLPILYPVHTPAPAPAPAPSASANMSVSASTTGNSTTKPSCVVSTITKTLQYASTGTAAANHSFTANGTLATATPSPSGYLSTGSKTVVKLETLAALASVGLSAVFFYFA